jgi:hypothetical protein
VVDNVITTGNITVVYGPELVLPYNNLNIKLMIGNLCATNDVTAYADRISIRVTDQDFFWDGDLYVLGNVCCNYQKPNQLWLGSFRNFTY